MSVRQPTLWREDGRPGRVEESLPRAALWEQMDRDWRELYRAIIQRRDAEGACRVARRLVRLWMTMEGVRR